MSKMPSIDSIRVLEKGGCSRQTKQMGEGNQKKSLKSSIEAMKDDNGRSSKEFISERGDNINENGTSESHPVSKLWASGHDASNQGTTVKAWMKKGDKVFGKEKVGDKDVRGYDLCVPNSHAVVLDSNKGGDGIVVVEDFSHLEDDIKVKKVSIEGVQALKGGNGLAR
ncbi:unnamed protein product [Dovyalis caffra]|uniref:Uncharacterized protein n=1 Tax=Dovyalis caffra TaxID=77055 RepID=A0AAV1RRA2_9ROSI|nr:unnamed protein product [Dovyalis caffra]